MAAKQRILVVDDDPDVNRLLQFALTNEGFSVSTATGGLAGIEVALSDRPDLAIVDVNMPEIDGFEVCRRLRAIPMLAQMPIIMLTVRAAVKDKLTGFDAGANDYVVKPVAMEELMARVRTLLLRADLSRSPEGPRPKGEGQIWSLFSLKGGVGVSGLAVNMAIALRGGWADSVALVDLGVGSSVESMLNLPPPRKPVSRTSPGREDWDEELIRRSLISHHSKLAVVVPRGCSRGSSVIDADSAGRILVFLRKTFQYVVVDTASAMSDLNWRVFELSDLILVILTADILSWKKGSTTLDLFRSMDISLRKVALVYNHVSFASGLTVRQAESFFGFPVAGEIPCGGAAFVASLNLGMPLVLEHPTDPAAVAIKELVKRLISRKPELASAPAKEGEGILDGLRSGRAPNSNGSRRYDKVEG